MVYKILYPIEDAEAVKNSAEAKKNAAVLAKNAAD
jgi:hypothetical protein